MKNAKLFMLICTLILAFALSACSSNACTSHVDANNDQKCDTCGTTVEAPACTNHTDANNDQKCDTCGATVEAPACTNHIDANGDFKCEFCKVLLVKDEDIITIEEALALCGESGNITEERYFIRANILTVTNAQYGSMIISDGTGEISVYGTYSYNGEFTFTEIAETPVKGDTVLLHCILQNYNGTKEVKNARLIDFVSNAGNFDASAYTEMSISDARNASIGDKVKVDGVVAIITYSNGMKPSGFILVDETSSIYVYNADAAQNVAIGNKVTIAASKTYWILSDETFNAQKFGYKGCNQLEDAYVLENDKKTDNAFDKSWITETTVKDIMETPVTEDITTLIYKVNALVVKSDGAGFTNYYFNDLDAKTGTYTYTQCNGSDFSWLDKFDGKICTVYLMALNAKSTASGCTYRVLPIEVIDESYTFNTNNTANHVVKYYGVDQFLSNYTADPELELITSVSSTLLGFKNATLSYSSSNTSVITFTETDGKVVMNCVGLGEATVTVTGSYGTNVYSEEVKITVTKPEVTDGATVIEAIEAEVGEKIIVKGIVGPSLVNKTGFYLIDDTGLIAVLISDASILKELSIGNEVILEGTRHVNTKGNPGYFGQSCLKDSKILVNNFGSHEYPTDLFITGKTLTEIAGLDINVDYTTTVFITTAKVTVEETKYYTNIYLTAEDGTQLRLYSSSASQYNWLKAYAGQTITVELAVCNWNDKDYYTGCVLAVITEDGKVYNTLNFI